MSEVGARTKDAGNSNEGPTLQLGRYHSPSRESSLRSLWSNLRDFLIERPVKMRPGTPAAFNMPRFGGSIRENVKEILHAGPKGNVKSDLLVNWSGQVSLWQNLRDLISPPKLPPLQTTSKPIAVKDIWSKNEQFSRTQAISAGAHVLAIALIVLVPLLLSYWLRPPVINTSPMNITPVDMVVSPYLKPAKLKAGGGGGQHDLKPASRGTPPKFSWTQFARPMVHPPAHPEIAMTPTIIGNPDIKMPDPKLPTWGDPLGHSNNASMGKGHGNGLGNGNGNGLGPGEGWNTGGGLPNAGSGGYGIPQCLYCPRADYSDEAMKVKIQGEVELLAVITADGRVTDIHVVKGLGYGLDENAVKAARTWRLRPALGPDGKPSAVREIIQMEFQLF
ncbi:MAG: energy transducer TonB [Candidatus Acidiferrales bacterium]